MEEPYASEMIERVFGEYRNQNQHLIDKYEMSIKTYTGTEFKEMNLLLRNKPAYLLSTYKNLKSLPDTVTAFKETRTFNKSLKAFFKELPPFIPTSHLILYRYIQTSVLNKNKDLFKDDAFTSISTNVLNTLQKIMVNDAEDMYTPLRIHLLPGIEYKLCPIDKISLVPEEDEILFAPHVKYYLCKHYVDYSLRVNNDGESIRDFILIPNEKRYTDLLEKKGWLQKWTNMITLEESYVFKAINKEQLVFPETTHNYYTNTYIFKFIQEIEYLIQKNISRITEYNNENAFPDINTEIQKIYLKITSSIDPEFTQYKRTLHYYLESLDESIVKTVVPKSKFSAYGEWMKAVGATHHQGGAGSITRVAPDDSEVRDLLKHIVADNSINKMLNEWIHKIQQFLIHFNIPVKEVFELPHWFYAINICGYIPIDSASDLNNEIVTQREKLTVIYRFAMKFSGLLWHYYIGNPTAQLPTLINHNAMSLKMKVLLNSYNVQYTENDVANRELLKNKYLSDPKLSSIFRDFTKPMPGSDLEIYKHDRITQNKPRHISVDALIEPLSEKEKAVLQDTTLVQRGITAFRLRGIRHIGELPWITGSALYKVKENGPFYKLAERNHKDILSGVSGSTQLMLELAKFFNMNERKVLLALLPWMYIHQDHSLFEMLLVSKTYIPHYEISISDREYIRSLNYTHGGYKTILSHHRHTSKEINIDINHHLKELQALLSNLPDGAELSKSIKHELDKTSKLIEKIEKEKPATATHTRSLRNTTESHIELTALRAYKFPDMDGFDYAKILGLQAPYG